MARRKGRAVSETVGIAPVQFPPGTVISFAGSTAPEGWMLCDGAAISRTDYAGLFAAIGTLWGVGDGLNTFNLPDLEGRFLRGADNGAAVDPDAGTRVPLGSGVANGVGSLQDDAIRNITGNFNESPTTATYFNSAGAFTISNGVTSIQPGTSGRTWASGRVNFSAANSVTTAADNRPANCSINYIIKL
jgi:microcystin-dependent protein